jgi:hypothetical protein
MMCGVPLELAALALRLGIQPASLQDTSNCYLCPMCPFIRCGACRPDCFNSVLL